MRVHKLWGVYAPRTGWGGMALSFALTPTYDCGNRYEASSGSAQP